MESKIAIIGPNGKLGTALIQGLIASGREPNSIEAILREKMRSQSDLAYLLSSGVRVSSDIHRASEASTIFITVRPEASGDVLERLSNVKFDHRINPEIISFVSGLSRRHMQPFFTGAHSPRIVPATCNVAIRSCHGVIVSDGVSPILQSLGTVISEREHWIRKGTITVGSGTALCACVLILGYENTKHISVFNWLSGLDDEIRQYKLDGAHISLLYSEVFDHMRALSLAYRTVLKYSQLKAEKYVMATMISTVKTLLVSGEFMTVDPIVKLAVSVATPGGCTEKGVGKIICMKQACSSVFLTEQVLPPINNRGLQFYNEAHESTKKVLYHGNLKKGVA